MHPPQPENVQVIDDMLEYDSYFDNIIEDGTY